MLCAVLAAGALGAGVHTSAHATIWTPIAQEGEPFVVKNKTVRYGSGSTWITKKVVAKGMCTNAFFGRDPLRGVLKECQIGKSGTPAAPPAAPSKPVTSPVVPKPSTPVVQPPAASYKLTIAYPAEGHIEGAVSGATFSRGTIVTLKAVAEGAYGVKAWTGDAASCGANNACQINMAGNKNVGVTFKTMPVGFAAGTTGGAGGKVVTVSTASALKDALCDKFDAAGICTDDTPRIIQLASVIDFTGTEGTTSAWICRKNANMVCRTQEMTTDYPVGTCAVEGHRLNDGSLDPIARKKMDYDAAGIKPLRVGSNKTLIGIGTKAGIKGKGLMIQHVSNVVIRNISLTDMNQWLIWGGDAITVVDAGQVWIDHNNFARIGRQFIATGLAEVGNLTISNNLFDGANEYAMSCDGKHYWTLLLAGKDENVTLIANRFSSTAGRAPEYGNGGILHIVNNLWDDDDGVIMVNPQRATSAVLEGNYFSPTSERMMPVAVPFADPKNPEKDLSPFPVYAPLDQTIDMANPTCLAVLGRNCASNYATMTTFGVDTLKGFLLHPEPIRMLKASPTLARGVGTVRPMPYAKVAGHVKAKAGPQADPDQ